MSPSFITLTWMERIVRLLVSKRLHSARNRHSKKSVRFLSNLTAADLPLILA